MTPKTLDKYIAALKKKAAAGGWSADQYQAELDKIKNEMAQQYLDDKITSEEYTKVSKQLKNAEKNPGLQGKPATNAAMPAGSPMTKEEMKALKDELKKQYMSGILTLDEWDNKAFAVTEAFKAGKTLKDTQAKIASASAPSAPVAPGAAAMSAKEKNEFLHALQKMAIDKTISKKDADKLMDKVDELFNNGTTAEDAQKLLDHATALVKAGFDADAAFGAAESVAKQNKALGIGAQSPPKGMTPDEYSNLEKALDKKKKAGLISQDEYVQLKGKLAEAYQKNKKASEIEKEIGCDPGTLATDKSIIKLGKEFRNVYGEASKEMQAKLDDFLKQYKPEMDELNQKLLDGSITPEEYKRLQLMTVRQKTMQAQIEQLSGVMVNANQKAMKLVNGEMLNVFAENANYQSYQLTQDTKMNLMFSVYDEHTAEKLIKLKPELLPRKEVNGKKDAAWNQKIIANAVVQAVIQGESIQKLAKRIADDTGETNKKAMIRYARTAMTAAQNSGRLEMLHRAQGMGIKCKKVWLATLDSRTRDSHQHMDGKKADVDEKFPNGLMYPGDPNGIPAEVYNCRCTLTYDYEGFPNDPTEDQRLMYEEWDEEVPVTKKDKNGKEYQATEIVHHRESRLITDMTYDEWKAAKEGSQLNQLNLAKQELAQLQKQIVTKGISESKVYKDLWKDPVTLADYPAKKAGIQAKLDYFDTEIDKYKQAQASGSSWATDEKIKELEKKRKLLKEFEQRGQLIEKRDAALAKVKDIYQQVGFGGAAAVPEVAKKAKAKAAKPAAQAPTQSLGPISAKKTPFGPEAYSKERKDKALWSTDKALVDSVMRPHTGEVWNKATAAEKDAIVEYTQSYHKFNEPLRGYEYGTSRYLGVGNTDLNASYANNGKRLNAMTDLIDKCSYDHDMWLQRGCGYGGMDKFFNCSPDLLQNGSEEELRKALLGTMPTEYAFGSMGSAKGKGFSTHPIIMNIYAPSGTKMMYVEPFSHYGGHMYDWDGKKKQSYFGDEFETLLQQGTQFRVTKIERKRRGGTIYIDMEVINQDTQQRWKK